MRILLTTTSYQDTPGRHHELLEKSGFDVVRARGPLSEAQMLELLTATGPDGPGFDGVLHGDDQLTRQVMLAALPRLKVLSKYGIGLDSVDVPAATELKIPVLFTPGVNHTTVAEHTFGLLIMLAKHMHPEINVVKRGQWKRITGRELAGKTLGVMGLGRIGKEVAKRAIAFDMDVIGYDTYWDDKFADHYNVRRCATGEELLREADVVSLHMNMTDENRRFLNRERIAMMRDGAMVVNCARGGLIDEPAVAQACKSGKLYGYAADVLEHEPMQPPHPFQDIDNIIVTPHIASRTFESVERQALRATLNLLNYLKGDKDFIQANSF
jgi:D-3-phosphoglycerate dehydrogenase